MRLRRGSLTVPAVAAGVAVVLSLTGCGGSGHDPRPADPDPPAPGVLAASTSPSGALSSAVTVDMLPGTVGSPMPPGFLGLSLEYPTLERYLGTKPRHLDPVFLALLRALNPGQGPVIRIGGDSTDRTWWPIRRMRAPAGANFSLSRRWTSLVRSLATDTRGKLILGINLAADSRRVASVEARRLLAGVGARHLAAFEIGNEPDDYPVTAWYWKRGRRVLARPNAYGVDDYLRQFSSWRAAMPRAVAVAGPALARTQWMDTALRSELDAHRRLGVVTFHRYPLRACETNRGASDYPTIPRLLSDSSSGGLAALLAPYADIARRAGRRFRLDELNSVSCRGKTGVSDTFASALWMLDTLFNLRAVGVDGVNVHMLPDSAYQAFSVSHSGQRWSASVSPVYYGLLMFARAFPPGARLLRLGTPGGSLKAWATSGPRGAMHIVLINQSPVAAVTVRVRMPGAQRALGSQTLVAPSLSATGGVSLGGVTFGSHTRTGLLPAALPSAPVPSVQGYYSVTVPAGSAVLLTR